MTSAGLAIFGLGAATAIGRNAVLSAAAVRAGIVRPRPVVDPEILDAETHEPVAISGHPIRGVTDGFTLFGRWLRMATAAVRDLIDTLPDDERAPAKWRRTALLVCAPTMDPLVYLADPHETLDAIRDQVCLALLEESGLAIPPHLIEVLPYGHVAFTVGVERARAHIGVDCDRALVVAVDSLLDPLLLESLVAQGRIKHAGSPVGFAPGEAGVALLLAGAHAGHTAPAAVISGLWFDLTPRDVYGATDRVVAEVCMSAMAVAGLDTVSGEIYVDLNGEVWRARQWGDAQPHLRVKFIGDLVLPAVNVGDTGAASGALATCLATRSFVRGYSAADHAAIVSLEDNGHVACAIITRGGTALP